MTTLSLLPEDILLLIVHFTDVESALSLLQTCKLLSSLANTKAFWLELVQQMRLTRPVPIQDASDATPVALRRAILRARALESKFHVYGEDSTIQHERSRKLDPLPLPDSDANLEYDDAWVMLLKDGRHLFQRFTGALCIRDIFSGDVVAKIPFEGDIYFLRHGIYKGRAVVGVLSMVESKLLLQVWDVTRPDEVLLSQNIDRNAMDLAGRKEYMYILIRIRDSPDTIFLQVINWETGDSNRFLISSTGSDIIFSKSGITDDHFLIHFTWGDRVEIAFYDLEMINSPLTPTSNKPLEPKYSHTFSFADGQVSQWSRVDTVWDDRICTSTVQSQEGSTTQILTLAELDVSPNANESCLIAPSRRSVQLVEDPYGNHVFHSGRYGKILMWKAFLDDADDDIDFVVKFAARPGLADVQDKESRADRAMRVITFIPLDFIFEHGALYDMDFDDAYGRLVLYMEDGTILVFEFI